MTEDRPKCLVSLAGRSLLQWQLGALRSAGIQDVAIVRGYCADAIQSTGVTYFQNPFWAVSNMVYSLCCGGSWLEKTDCVISYGDIVFHPDIVRALATSDQKIRIAYDIDWLRLWLERFEDPLGDAESFRVANGRLLEIGGKGVQLPSIQGQYMGLLSFTPAGWRTVKRHLEEMKQPELYGLDMTSLLQQLIREEVPIGAVPISGRWCEVDSDRDLRLYERKAELPGWTHDWRF